MILRKKSKKSEADTGDNSVTDGAEAEDAEATGAPTTRAARSRRAAEVAEKESASSEDDSDDVAEYDAGEKSAPDDRDENGPFDESEANPVRPYIDLGGVKVLPREGLNLRLEVEESTKRIIAVGLDYAGSTLQIQPFAAPRSTGLWHETREQIRDQIAKQGGTVTEIDGTFGPELRAEVPVVANQGGQQSTRIARFVGVDGPRWFLRGVVAGDAAADGDAADQIDDLFRSIVVVRGTQPMPPRDLIPLKMPVQPGAAAE